MLELLVAESTSQSPLVGASGPALRLCFKILQLVKSQSPLVGASGPAMMEINLSTRKFGSQSPLVGASGPADRLPWPPPGGEGVSIPSGRGFWAGQKTRIGRGHSFTVSIPSGRGFWAGDHSP